MGWNESQLSPKPLCSPQSQQPVSKRVPEQEAAREPKGCSAKKCSLGNFWGGRFTSSHAGGKAHWPLSWLGELWQPRFSNKVVIKVKRTVSPDFNSVAFNCILFTRALTEKWGIQYWETQISAKDLVCYNYTEHRWKQNLYSKTITKKQSKTPDPHWHQNWSEFTAKNSYNCQQSSLEIWELTPLLLCIK